MVQNENGQTIPAGAPTGIVYHGLSFRNQFTTA
jgi:hypothetical protein